MIKGNIDVLWLSATERKNRTTLLLMLMVEQQDY